MIFGSRRRRIALLALSAVTGCVQAPPPPAPVLRPTPLPMPAPAVAADWQDWPVTPGDWRYERDARGSRALFGRPGGEARAVVRCDRAPSRVTLSRAGAAGTLTVRTTSTTRALAASAADGAPFAIAVLAPNDPLLDAIAFSRGRFTLEQPGATPLVLPPWPEIGRVIEDCRAPQ